MQKKRIIVPKEDFMEVIEGSKNWTTAINTLRIDFGLSDERNMRRRAAKMGIRPGLQYDVDIPDGFKIKGVSTMVDATGNKKIEWIKTSQDKERQFELLKIAAAALLDDVSGKFKPIEIPESANSDLLACYPVPEPHVGMYAWSEEGGSDYDCDIAERIILGAMERLVEAAPDAEEALIYDPGDFYHSDTMENITRRGGNHLDVDTRWARVVQIGARIEKALIKMALQKHKKVKVIKVPGNHDEQTSILLSMILAEHFRKEPRVDIDLAVSPFRYYEFGKNLIGMCHGENTKPANLPGIMATDQSQAWGRALFRHWLIGHIHHKSALKEFHGCTVESLRTIAANDSWHHSHGYRSGRDMQLIVFHREFGEVERHRVGVEQLNGDVNKGRRNCDIKEL